MRKLVLLLCIAAIIVPGLRTELTPYLPFLADIPFERIGAENAYVVGGLAGMLLLALIAALVRTKKAPEPAEREPPKELTPEEVRDRILATLEDCKSTLRYDLCDIDSDEFADNAEWVGVVNEASEQFRFIERLVAKGEYDQAYAVLQDAEYGLWLWDDHLSEATNDNLVDLKDALRPLVKVFPTPVPPALAPAEKTKAEPAAA